MLKNENIICISTIDWDFIWQGHQEIMSVLAKNGNRVLFIENTGVRMPRLKDMSRIKSRIKNWFSGVSGIREVMPNLYVYSPLVVPFPYLRLAKWINRHLTLSVLNRWIKTMHFTESVVWSFLPTPLSLDIIDNLNSKITIYYCIDSFQASSDAARKIRMSEINLLKKSDLVFVTSRELNDYCSKYNDKVYIFPFAVNFQEFQGARLNNNLIPNEIKAIKKPIIGYIGGVHKWIDFALVRQAALHYPEYSFVFVGPIQTSISLMTGLKNVYFLGQKEHKKIPYFINTFDVCLIPYLLTEYTNNVYPTKLNEYHALGKPVVSTNLPEIVNFNRMNDDLVFIGRNYTEFNEAISLAIRNTSDRIINQRISSAEKNSWSSRVVEMSNLIEDTMEKKLKIPLDWQNSFVRLYKRVRRKSIKLTLAALSVYLLIFYTPLAWFMAGYLKVSQRPQAADSIVVFAGGVGESGRAGQGYEERVLYAVELFKSGYAKNLIFSSGHTYSLKETVIMKAIAVSLGVPQDAITLEDRAKNTYENVIFTKDILSKEKRNKIILISSPYHMRRALLVFRKAVPEVNVICAPIPNSFFYAHGTAWKQVSIQQVEGILHEYIGILYYWWRGYI